MPAFSRCPIARSFRWRRPEISRANWEASTRGLNPRDLAMHVVLPEVDGRIFATSSPSRSVARAAPALRRQHSTGGRSYQRDSRSRAGLGAIASGRKTRAPCRACAGQLSQSDGRLANGVGLDTPQSLIDVVAAMRGEGYAISDTPIDAARDDEVVAGRPNQRARRTRVTHRWCGVAAGKLQGCVRHAAGQCTARN